MRPTPLSDISVLLGSGGEMRRMRNGAAYSLVSCDSWFLLVARGSHTSAPQMEHSLRATWLSGLACSDGGGIRHFCFLDSYLMLANLQTHVRCVCG